MSVQNSELQEEFRRVIADAYVLSSDLGQVVESLLKEGREHPLSAAQATKLLAAAVRRLKQTAERNGHEALGDFLAGDIDAVVARIAAARTRIGPAGAPHSILVNHNGVEPKKVEPTPRFHGRDVPMHAGFVETRDVDLWQDNARLEIHVGQFRRLHGRGPNANELLDIMLTQMPIPGMEKEDEFEIPALARSIAANGVQKPPILDTDATVLDGNRRIAACYLILNSADYTAEEKARVRHIFVWQLSEFATPPDREAVIVALNFEPDYKQTWPEYVKARKISEEWHAMLAASPRASIGSEQQKMKRELTKKFALPDTNVVNRYLKMVELANEFEEHHIGRRGRDEFETKHRANQVFQYFDELQKGARAGGVAWTLGQNDNLRQLTFDLLFEGKFRNWTVVRNLKHVNSNELLETLVKAKNQPDVELAQDIVDTALEHARSRSQEARTIGINPRIDAFVELLEQLTPRTVREELSQESIARLQQALRLVDKLIEGVLEERANHVAN
jgi:hypothetical protein